MAPSTQPWTLKTLKEYNKYNLHFYQLEVVCRYRDPQLQVGENNRFLLNLGPKISKSWFLKTYFIPNVSDFID